MIRVVTLWLWVSHFRGSLCSFVPLSCNNDFTPCVEWSRRFDNRRILPGRTTIECGECIIMDQLDYSLEFVNGLDINGKLVIPDGVSVEIRTPIIAVQGELHVAATKQVDGSPTVRITMEDGSDNYFVPIRENAQQCNGRCLVGSKAIVVAGGKVNCKFSIQCIWN
jgi:hypothetical protein